jgi:hypothetical protein
MEEALLAPAAELHAVKRRREAIEVRPAREQVGGADRQRLRAGSREERRSHLFAFTSMKSRKCARHHLSGFGTHKRPQIGAGWSEKVGNAKNAFVKKRVNVARPKCRSNAGKRFLYDLELALGQDVQRPVHRRCRSGRVFRSSSRLQISFGTLQSRRRASAILGARFGVTRTDP